MPQNIFILTGAGVSAESGLGTFRDKQGEGIWAKFDPMKLATPEAFARDPEAVLAFYDLRRRNLRGAKPNAAHFACFHHNRRSRSLPIARRGGHFSRARRKGFQLHKRDPESVQYRQPPCHRPAPHSTSRMSSSTLPALLS